MKPSRGAPPSHGAAPGAGIALLVQMPRTLKGTSGWDTGCTCCAKDEVSSFFVFLFLSFLFLTQILSVLISSRWEDVSSPAVLCTAAGHPGLWRFCKTPSLSDPPASVTGGYCCHPALQGKAQRTKMLNHVSPGPSGILVNFVFLLPRPEQSYSQKKGTDSLLFLPYARVS